MVVIFDNIVFYGQRIGGVSSVWYELIKRIILNKNITSYFIEYKYYINLFRKKLIIPQSLIILKSDFGIKLRRYLNPTINLKEKFIFHSSYYRVSTNKRAINITTVHDFTYEYFAFGLQKKIHCWQKYQAIRKSHFIICVSENTKKDLLKFIPNIDSKKIRIIYNGVSDDYFPIYENPSHISYSNESYALYIGSRASYKNFILAVEAVATSKLNLVIVGSVLSKKEELFLNTALGKDRYKFLDNISNEELNVLYNNAYVFIYLSLYEGFGIPVLEAQKAGCPVIAYNSSSIPEIIGDTPLLINELSVISILNCFNILTDQRCRLKIVKDGIKNASQFSWDKMYSQIEKLYNEAWLST
jgi:mannosyltransferase